jgi:hypothetical protein
MKVKAYSSSPPWLAAIFSALVALGTQMLVEGLVPFDVGSWFSEQPSAGWHRAGDPDIWAVSALIRLVSFSLGGVVGALLVRGVPKSLVICLLVATAVATVFAQFPTSLPAVMAVLWCVSAPAGVLLGLGVARAAHGVA